LGDLLAEKIDERGLNWLDVNGMKVETTPVERGGGGKKRHSFRGEDPYLKKRTTKGVGCEKTSRETDSLLGSGTDNPPIKGKGEVWLQPR